MATFIMTTLTGASGKFRVEAAAPAVIEAEATFSLTPLSIGDTRELARVARQFADALDEAAERESASLSDA